MGFPDTSVAVELGMELHRQVTVDTPQRNKSHEKFITVNGVSRNVGMYSFFFSS